MSKKDKKKGKTITQLSSAARYARTALAERLMAHGFYAGQDQIMLTLAQHEGLTPGELASRVGVRPPTVTKTINRLQEQGYVNRQQSKSDGRQSHVYLTDAGQSALSSINRAIKKTEKKLLDGLSKKDCKRLHKLLCRLEKNLSSDDK